MPRARIRLLNSTPKRWQRNLKPAGATTIKSLKRFKIGAENIDLIEQADRSAVVGEKR